MKRTLALWLAALMLMGILASCSTPADPVDTTDSAETTEEPAETTKAPETEPPAPEKQPYEEEVVAEFDGYTVTLSAPIAVFHGRRATMPGVTLTSPASAAPKRDI